MLYESTYYGVQSIDFVPSLSHHGILGMSWGKRNGPPYPLDSSDHSAAEKKAGWRKSLSRSGRTTGRTEARQKAEGNTKSKKSFKLTDRQKTALKVAGGVAVAGLAAYGVYKLRQSNAKDSIRNMAKELDIDLSHRAGDANTINNHGNEPVKEIASSVFNQDKAKQIAEETGFPLKTSPNTTPENSKLANPNFGKPEFANNCGHSVIAWYLNELGLKVHALPVEQEYRDGGMVPTELNRYFKGLNWGIPAGSPPGATTMRITSASSKNDISKKILEISNGENSAGIWRAPGHYMGWKVENGIVTFVNPQSGADNCDDWFSKLDKKIGKCADRGIDIARLDNVEINAKRIKKAVTD